METKHWTYTERIEHLRAIAVTMDDVAHRIENLTAIAKDLLPDAEFLCAEVARMKASHERFSKRGLPTNKAAELTRGFDYQPHL